MQEWINEFVDTFKLNFIEKERWKLIVEGFGNTLKITFFAVLIGIAIGVVIALIRSTYDNNKEDYKRKGGIGYVVMSILNGICNIYLTVIRGTPVTVQLLIMYFVICASSRTDL